MQYEVDRWAGHPNTHCPFCSFATTSANATEVMDGHVAAVHSVQLREQLATEMAEKVKAEREAMSKEQLLEAAQQRGVEGLSTRNTRDQIIAALDAADAATAAAPAASEDA